MAKDQASTLRRLVNSKDGRGAPKGTKGKNQHGRPPQRVRVISITSGKGGVGKTNVTINLAYALSSLGKKVFILDADLGLANIDVLLNISPRYKMEHVLSGERHINDIIVDGPGNIKILPASSGLSELAELSRDEQMRLFSKLGEIDQPMDYLLLDTGAGIASNVLRFNATADEIMVVATPEPTSMTDAYAVIKILATKYHIRKFSIITNMVESRKEAQSAFATLQKVAHDFLHIKLNHIGYVFRDPALNKVVRMQKPLLEVYPQSPAGRCFTALARQVEHQGNITAKMDIEKSQSNFWDRLMQWKRNR